MLTTQSDNPAKKTWWPKAGTPGYYLLLAAVTGLLLGPLGGLAAAYMNFSLGFFIGGQVLVGILGSVITFRYGAEGRHGANYMQTMAGVLSSMCGMAVLIQAMYWLGMPQPPAWKLLVFFIAVGMFGIGVGVIYTPLLVDRLKLTYPSGAAVASIIRALTDPKLLRSSILKLGGGIAAGIAIGIVSNFAAGIDAGISSFTVVGLTAIGLTVVAHSGLSASTFGAGMIVSQRIAIPSLVMGLIGFFLTPSLREWGWIGEHDPFRKIAYLISLAMILGASLVDLSLIGYETVQRLRGAMKTVPEETPPQMRVNFKFFFVWVAFWGLVTTVLATQILHQPVGFILLALGLVLLFLIVNGISTGISDSNPISSAFVLSVLLMSLVGLKDPLVGLFAASILLICCAVGVDMQQSLATGRRLGTSRMIQFHFQWGGVIIGAVLSLLLATVFFKAYPDLLINAVHQEVPKWQSAMTYKIVGILEDIGNLKPHQIYALLIGFSYGLVVQILRKLWKRSQGYKNFLARMKESGDTGKRWLGMTIDLIADAVLLSSPYAFAFGGFVDVTTVIWFAAGGVVCSATNFYGQRHVKPGEEMPEEIGTTFLVGGGLIAGDALWALAAGMWGLFGLLLMT